MDIKYIKELISLLEKSGVQRMTIKEKNGIEISLDKGGVAPLIGGESQVAVQRSMHQVIPPAPPMHSLPLPIEGRENDNGSNDINPNQCIKSPMVGTFYGAESPDSPNFVQVGTLINKGDTLCIIEAMKVMNEVKSDRQGKVTKILVENGSPVEYGQWLFVVE